MVAASVKVFVFTPLVELITGLHRNDSTDIKLGRIVMCTG